MANFHLIVKVSNSAQLHSNMNDEVPISLEKVPC